jgi:predicted HicB family RNase H-like nuclease
MMEYKGYIGKVEFDAEAEIFRGEVLHMRDMVTFQGTSVEELRQAFVHSLDNYLEHCEKKGVTPEKPLSGNLMVRLEPALHREISTAAARLGVSINRWIADALQQALGRLGEMTTVVGRTDESDAESFNLYMAEDGLHQVWGILHGPSGDPSTTTTSLIPGEDGPSEFAAVVTEKYASAELRPSGRPTNRYYARGKGPHNVS